MTEKLLTIQEVSEQLRTPVKTLRSWKRVGRGPQSARVGARLLYKQTDVDAYVAQLFGDDAS